MKKLLHIDSLCIEVTRRCNMSCEHCLRGDAQNIDITDEILNNTLSNITSINTITFTGGEPTLNIKAIANTLEICKKNNIDVDHIYIVTNGKNITDEFIHILIEWYLYCDNIDDLFGVALSQDPFHEDINPENIRKLQALRFFNIEDKKTNYDYGLINEGRAKNITSYIARDLNTTPTIYGSKTDKLSIYEPSIYIAANGDIKIDCDWAYDNNVTRIGNILTDNLYDCLNNRFVEE